MATALALSPTFDGQLPSMSEGIKETLLSAFRQLMRPLVRILLRNGVTYREFADTAKTVFVEVARRDFAESLEAESPSAIGLATGLSVDEVIRIDELIRQKRGPSTENLNRIGRILGAWHQDPDFTGPYGLPLELDSSDTNENSFFELAARYAEGFPASELLAELKRIEVVSELPGGKLRVLTRSYIPQQSDSAAFQFLGVSMRDLAETLDANVNGKDEEGFFERRVWTPMGIDSRDMPAFDKLVNKKGMEFLETLDNWLSGKESDAEKLDSTEKIHVGVGVYLFSDANRSFREK